MSDSPNQSKPPIREFRSVTGLRQALAALAEQSQSNSSAGHHAWRSFWEKHDHDKLSPWQAYQLGLSVAAAIEAPEYPATASRDRITPPIV